MKKLPTITYIKRLRSEISYLLSNYETKLEFSIDEDLDSVIYNIEYSKDCLEYGKMWLGKVLEYLGDKSPYVPDDERIAVAQIVETADLYTVNHGNEFDSDICNLPNLYDLDDIDLDELVKSISLFRTKIQTIIDNVIKLEEDTKMAEDKTHYSISRANTFQHLSEAKMELGLALSKIRDYVNRSLPESY
jgi:hypothetical protein